MSDQKASPRLPPRWFIRFAWFAHRRVYRVTGGRLGLWRPKPNGWGTLRLSIPGRRTGIERSVMVGYFEDGPNLITLAMNGWGEGEPAWWLNLQAHPDARVDLVEGPGDVTGRIAVGEERDRLWKRWREIDKNLDAFTARRSSETAVVVLEPRRPESHPVSPSIGAAGSRSGGALMRAVVNTEYGGPEVLRLSEVERPVPQADEVLVKVHASTVNRTDCGFRAPEPWFVRLFAGLRRPRRTVLGSEFAGVVADAGSKVTGFVVGDEVFGVNADRFGAHAEYLCVRESAPIAAKPSGMTFEEAAAVCDGAILAMTCLTWAKLRAGQRILIYGASGSIGTAGVQLAKHLGAHVTAVCSTASLEVVGSLGPDEIIDYLVEDFAANGETYDVVFDAVGKKSFRACKASLSNGGCYVSTDLGPHSENVALMVWTRFARKKAMMPLPRYTKDKVLRIKDLVDAGDYRAVVDRVYPLDSVVDATRYVETEQKTGNVVIAVTAPD